MAAEAQMTTISRRKLHKHAGKVLKRVSRGEVIDVVDKGKIVATLIPPPKSPWDSQSLTGSIRPASPVPVDFASLPRVSSNVASAKILRDLRRDG
jgi:antitoxin (DNA-binding transcriptional repressor) of toxin-antitoxin stability system